ncbi:MAG: hypothetical protein M3O31_14170 [Acidobacteriota bacterium]|nr:hypothetical protein [Acidobacteriota bacterium]
MNRTSMLWLVLVFALSAHAAQPGQPVAGSNWQHIQVLPAGTSINVKARSSHASCKVKSVDADSLTCTDKKDMVFQRTEVVSIKISRRGRSTLVGLGIGGVLGAAIGAAATPSCKGQSFCIVSKGGGAVVLGVLGGAVGTAIGVATDFTRSTVYKAP